jgi:hypothetical protein
MYNIHEVIFLNTWIIDTSEKWQETVMFLVKEKYKPFKIQNGLDTDKGLRVRFYSKGKPLIEIITFSEEVAAVLFHNF